MGNSPEKPTKRENSMLLSLINNRLIKKITESTNYRSIYLLDMFWKIFVSKVDKIPSLKITYKKYLRRSFQPLDSGLWQN